MKVAKSGHRVPVVAHLHYDWSGFSQICQIQLTNFLAVRNPKAHIPLKRTFGLWLCGASFYLHWGKEYIWWALF